MAAAPALEAGDLAVPERPQALARAAGHASLGAAHRLGDAVGRRVQAAEDLRASSSGSVDHLLPA
jgi:hypothetical protein